MSHDTHVQYSSMSHDTHVTFLSLTNVPVLIASFSFQQLQDRDVQYGTHDGIVRTYVQLCTHFSVCVRVCVRVCVCVCVSNCVQHMISKEENLQADVAAPQVTQVALYRLRNNEGGTPEVVPGCVCEARGKL